MKYFYFTQVNLKSLPECFSLIHFIPKHNVILFTALHFINKSCCLFLSLILKNIKNVVLSCTQVSL